MSIYLLEIVIKMTIIICHTSCIIDIIKIYAAELVVVPLNKAINSMIANFFLDYLLNEIYDILRSRRYVPFREVVDAIDEYLLFGRVQYTIGFYLSGGSRGSFACKAVFEGIRVEIIFLRCGIVIR